MIQQRQFRGWRTVVVCAGLVAITWIVFGQTLGHDFVNFDDDKYVYDNARITGGLQWGNVAWLFTHSHASLWHPLTSMTHMLDCQLYGLHPAGHHFTNVLLHSVAVVLLFLVWCSLTSEFWPSAFVAVLFAIHPMRVESVAWISERKDVLSAVFLMLTLAAYARYARRPSLSRYAIVAVLVACGMMSKATFVTVPFVLLLVDYWPLGRGRKDGGGWMKLILEKLPLLALAMLASAATFFAQTVTMASMEQLPLLPRIKNAIVSVVIYLRQFFWPHDLAVFYPHPHDQLHPWVVLASALLIVGLTIPAVLIRCRHPYVIVGWLWFLVMLTPVLGIIQVGLQANADRFTYLPYTGLFIAISWAITDLSQSWRYRESVLWMLGGLSVVTMAVCSIRQATYWKDSVSLWTHTLAVTSDNETAHIDLAVALWDQGKVDESRQHTRAANLIHWKTVLKDFPFDNKAHDELGTALIQQGEIHEAIAQWRASLEIDPMDGNAANNLAWVLATSSDAVVRDGAKAVELAERASHLRGGESPVVYRTLAAAYAESGRFAQAADTATRAMEMATAAKNGALAETLRNEIKSYTANQPHRETPAR